MELKKFARLSMLLSLSVVLNIIESLIPLFSGSIPGIKLGLANIVILFVLYEYTFKDVLYISILRVFLVGILKTGIFSISFLFSLGGAIASIVIMYLFKKATKLSMIGVSITGSIAHSIGQIIIAILVLKTTAMMYYLPILILISIPTGIFTGIISKELVKYLK